MKLVPNRGKPRYLRLDKDEEEAIERYMQNNNIDNFSVAIRHMVRRGLRMYSNEKRDGDWRWQNQMK